MDKRRTINIYKLPYIKEQIESVKGYKLLSKVYEGSKRKLDIKCNKGHEYRVTWSDFNTGRRCPYCAGLKKLTYEYVKEQIESIKGYNLISKNYINAHAYLLIQCNKGHIYKVTWNKWQQSKRCPYCSGNVKHTYNYVKEQIEKEGYVLLSKSYKNVKSKIKIQCNKEHIYKASFEKFQRGQRCLKCYKEINYSKPEREIVKQLLPNERIIANDRTQLINPKTGHNLELDIWIPELKKAIEFNGDYWHSSDYSKYKDFEKLKQCKEKDIKLIVINDQNWLNNKSECIKQIIKLIKEN